MNNNVMDLTNSVYKICVNVLIIGVPTCWLRWMNVHVLGAETRWGKFYNDNMCLEAYVIRLENPFLLQSQSVLDKY
jgi:hypothetical protein